MREVNQGILRFIQDKELYLLRDLKTGKPLNVSYTKEGLYYTCNKTGKLLCFQNGKLVVGSNHLLIMPSDNKPLKFNQNISIELYKPLEIKMNPIEMMWVEKAYKMLYHVGH